MNPPTFDKTELTYQLLNSTENCCYDVEQYRNSERSEPIYSDIKLALEVLSEIDSGNIPSAVNLLRHLAQKSKIFPQSWLLNQVNNLNEFDWSSSSKKFIEQEFVGNSGYFFIIAPYRIRRESSDTIKLTAILGQVSNCPNFMLDTPENFLQKEFGVLNQPIPVILPYNQIAACGQAGSESSEAFIVANSWQIPHSVQGPSLNDMTEQRRRFDNSGQECIQRIWEQSSAELILEPLSNPNLRDYYRNLEYQLHEAGHASGLGLESKIKEEIFTDYWNGSVEESRSDGIELEIAANILPDIEAGKLAAVNICVRQGLDAHRRGGLDRDGDAGASLINFAKLWDSGEVQIKNGRLALRELTYPGLLRATKPLREWAMKITRKELRLNYSQGLYRLYGSVEIHPAIEEIFLGLVIDPCKGFYQGLR